MRLLQKLQHQEQNSAWMEKGLGQDIFIKRFRRSLKGEEVYLRAYDTVPDEKRWIYRDIERYNTIRPHSSLGGKTPDKIHTITPAEELVMASLGYLPKHLISNKTCHTDRSTILSLDKRHYIALFNAET
jgi:putative transposase